MTPAADIAARFAAFDSANPRVWDLFQRFAWQAIRSGRDHYSADAIIHRIRWHVNVETVVAPGEEFKINDHFSSRYARKWADTFPERADFFETRRLSSEPPEPGPFGRGSAE